MSFAPFTSYADSEGDAVALWNTRTAHQMAYQTLQMEAFRAALPPPVPKPTSDPKTSPLHDAAWPVSWIFVAHASRGLAQLVANLSSEQREVCALEREAEDWISEAADRLWAPLSPDRHAAFRAWWSASSSSATF